MWLAMTAPSTMIHFGRELSRQHTVFIQRTVSETG